MLGVWTVNSTSCAKLPAELGTINREMIEKTSSQDPEILVLWLKKGEDVNAWICLNMELKLRLYLVLLLFWDKGPVTPNTVQMLWWIIEVTADHPQQGLANCHETIINGVLGSIHEQIEYNNVELQYCSAEMKLLAKSSENRGWLEAVV